MWKQSILLIVTGMGLVACGPKQAPEPEAAPAAEATEQAAETEDAASEEAASEEAATEEAAPEAEESAEDAGAEDAEPGPAVKPNAEGEGEDAEPGPAVKPSAEGEESAEPGPAKKPVERAVKPTPDEQNPYPGDRGWFGLYRASLYLLIRQPLFHHQVVELRYCFSHCGGQHEEVVVAMLCGLGQHWMS